MWRLTEEMVRSMLLTAWRLAISPTRTSPDFENATTDGVVRPPSALAITVGSPPSRTETTELVVPRSIPTARDMCCFLLSLETAGAQTIERSALNFTQGACDVNPNLSEVRSTLEGGSGGTTYISAE